MDSYTVRTSDDLLEFLGKSKILDPFGQSVPSDEVEKWCMYRLLSTLCNAGDLQFPLTIEHRDKPDFKSKVQTSEIGIEITKATTEQYERARALGDKFYPDAWLDLSHFKWGAPDKSSKEILKILETSLTRFTGPALYGNHIENDWPKSMLACLLAKTDKLNKADFDKFEMNWLLIFDNLTVPGFKYEVALSKLTQDLRGYWERQQPIKFDRLIIESRDKLLFFENSGYSSVAVLDLWK